MGELTALTYLDLYNNDLTGAIPAELGKLTALTELALAFNDLTGAIPAELGELTALTGLYLNGNNLTGAIPAELGKLTALTELWLYYNGLTGEIPAELGKLTALTELDLSYTDLTGEIPAELGKLTALTWLDLRDSNLTGCIPVGLEPVSRLFTGGLPFCALALSVTPQGVIEGTNTEITVTAAWSGAYSRAADVAVAVSVTGGTAVADTDFTAVSDFTITIVGGEGSGTDTFTLAADSDTIVEVGGETVNVAAAVEPTLATSTPASLTIDDADTPTAPTGLTATGGNSEVTLSWTAAADGGSAITGHEYQQKAGSEDYGAWMRASRTVRRAGPTPRATR